MKKSDKPGSILRIQEFSDSESDGEQDKGEVIEDQADSSLKDDEISDNSEEIEKSNHEIKGQKKTRKKGIIFIGSIPQHMNVAICKEFMEKFGEVGRIFLQPDKKGSKF